MADDERRALADEIRSALDGTSPGPWRWAGRLHTGPELSCWVPGQGRTIVMSTRRLGMQEAQPQFVVDGLIVDSTKLAVREVPYRDDIVDIDHPDARLIAAAPDLLRRALVALAEADLRAA